MQYIVRPASDRSMSTPHHCIEVVIQSLKVMPYYFPIKDNSLLLNSLEHIYVSLFYGNKEFMILSKNTEMLCQTWLSNWTELRASLFICSLILNQSIFKRPNIIFKNVFYKLSLNNLVRIILNNTVEAQNSNISSLKFKNKKFIEHCVVMWWQRCL